MLRNRSRTVTSKQAIMTDKSSLPSPTHNQISSFLVSPKFFSGFLANNQFDSQTILSPTRNLEGKLFSNFNNPFGYSENLNKRSRIFPENKELNQKLDSKGIGLALTDSFDDEKTGHILSNTNNRMVLFGSKLKIQIPSLPPTKLSPSESPKSPADFGIKTRNSQFLGCLSAFGSINSSTHKRESPPAVIRDLSLSEMELSEDYTCVIFHGPNPKTTHIYDNCIVDSCCGGVGLSEIKKECGVSLDSSENFLSFCYTCKKDLEEGKDIYMYRGEKAFCSEECRCQEMLFDGVENSAFTT